MSIQSAPKLDKPKGRDIHTTLNYHKPNADGSPPHPTYTDRPETYQREVEVHPVTIHDVTGRESEFTLDGNGFQFIKHTSKEKEFVEEEKIKEYYDEIAQFLKDVYVTLFQSLHGTEMFPTLPLSSIFSSPASHISLLTWKIQNRRFPGFHV